MGLALVKKRQEWLRHARNLSIYGNLMGHLLGAWAFGIWKFYGFYETHMTYMKEMDGIWKQVGVSRHGYRERFDSALPWWKIMDLSNVEILKRDIPLLTIRFRLWCFSCECRVMFILGNLCVVWCFLSVSCGSLGLKQEPKTRKDHQLSAQDWRDSLEKRQLEK